MPHFFCERAEGNRIRLVGENARHMERVLRMKVGELFSVSTQDGKCHQCSVELFDEDGVWGTILETTEESAEPSVKITLYQALPKGDKMEWILQKAVELGVYKVVPVLTHRCVSRPDAKSMAKKRVRYQKIVEAAAKQSGRGCLPEVGELLTFEELCAELQDKPGIVCYEGGGKRLCELVTPDCEALALVIGSEGGFEVAEIERLQACGVQAATLGKLILRCETAPLAALSVLMQLTGNL